MVLTIPKQNSDRKDEQEEMEDIGRRGQGEGAPTTAGNSGEEVEGGNCSESTSGKRFAEDKVFSGTQAQNKEWIKGWEEEEEREGVFFQLERGQESRRRFLGECVPLLLQAKVSFFAFSQFKA